MASTQVFTLGLGVTFTNPLGTAIEQLRRDLERLRRQADGTRLGRLIGEVIRLGLELGKVRQVERELALDQQQQHEEQIARLDDEVGAVERLRRHYLLLDQVLTGLARFKPLRIQSTLVVVQHSSLVMQHASVAASGQSQARPPAASPAKQDNAGAVLRGAGAVAAIGGTAVAGGYVAREGMRRLPPDTRREITDLAREELRENSAGTIGKIGKALITGEDGEAKAKGVGGALGELGGRMFGTVLSGLFKSKWAKEYGADVLGPVGEGIGERVASLLYNWGSQDAKAQRDDGGKPGSEAADTPAAPAQEQPQSAASTIGTTAVVASGLVVVSGLGSDSATNTQMTIVSATSAHWQDSRTAFNGVSLRPGDEGRDAGAVAGEVDEAAPRGKAGDNARRGNGQPQGAEQSQALQEQAGDATLPTATASPPTAGTPLVFPLPGKPTLGASLHLPKAATLLKRVPGLAYLSAGLQAVDTYTSDGTTAQKLEGYGQAAGGLGGTLAGVAAGAALGSVVPVLGTVLGGLIGGVLGGMVGESAGSQLGRAVASFTGNDASVAGEGTATPAVQPVQVTEPIKSTSQSESASATPESLPTPPPIINQQFTFTANMPVTLNNNFDDPTTLQQLEAIARRVLDDLMRQARSVQMVDQPNP